MHSVISHGEVYQDSSTRSWVSRVDPRIKIVCIVSFLVFIVLARGPSSLAILTLSVILFLPLSRCSFRSILRSLRPFLWLVGVTFLLNLFLTPGRVLVQFWSWSLTYDGLTRGALLSWKLILMISAAHILLLTAHPTELTDGLTGLLFPLRRLRLPVGEIAMVSALTLRLIPGIGEEAKRIFSSQRARGAFGGGIVRRMRAAFPFVVPLLSSCLQRGERLTQALESRAYEPDRRTLSRGVGLRNLLFLGLVWTVGFVSVWMGVLAGRP